MGEWRNPRGHSDRPIMGASQKKISNQILKNMISRITYQSKSLWNIILKAKNTVFFGNLTGKMWVFIVILH